MIELPKEFDSIFRYIVVVSQRAEQLINGAKARAESRFKKPTLKARDDVDAEKVDWRVLTQEELDAHRQALVEQFRAEVGAATEPATDKPIPDVLPTAEAPVVEAAAGNEERDDELARLQRLLGMTQQAAEAQAEAKDKPKDKPKKEAAAEVQAEPEAAADGEAEEAAAADGKAEKN
jgi:DNA-directed RNA polymerase subunit K/omega